MPKLIERVQLDEGKRDHELMLRDLQCNILSSHGRQNTHYFLLRFRSTVAKQVLKALALGSKALPKAGLPEGVEPLASEFQSRARRMRGKNKAWATKEHTGNPVELFPTLLLSARCYRDFLGDFEIPPDEAFNRGRARSDEFLPEAARLHDPPDLRGDGLHALYAVGHNLDEAAWTPKKEAIVRFLQQNDVDVRDQAGYALWHYPNKDDDDDRYPIEPFGYRDAISQPKFFQADLEKDGVIRDGVNWPALAPLSSVLVEDPNGGTDRPWGTYFVYRKLKQNVAKFYSQAADLAAANIPPRPDGTRLEPEDVADLLIGRKVNGDPLDPNPPADQNDFRYPVDSVCPMHAHVRKVNPREEYARGHRIVRRSTVYGPRYQRKENGRPVWDQGDPTIGHPDGVGLMFFCCQSNIAEQFETIQGQWANARAGGADTVIAQMPMGGNNKRQLNKIGVNGSGIRLDYEPVVELLEGEYFFAPSISFFSKL